MNKRILSLTLALVMILGTFTAVFATDAKLSEQAAKDLKEVGVLQGNEEGNLELDKALERRDAVVLLARLLGEEDKAKKFEVTKEMPSWTDVRTDAYYVPFFAWTETNKYFEGNGDGTFGPRKQMTVQEYSAVLLRALGYETSGKEDWKNVTANAKKLGLLNNVTEKQEDVLVRGTMSVMTLNALNTKVKGSEKTLAEELGLKLPVREVKVEDVFADNLKQVKVQLNQEVELDAVQDKDNYSIEGLTVERVNLNDKNQIVIEVENAMKLNKEYELVIKGLKFDGKSLDHKAKFKAVDNEIPHVISVEGLGTKAFKINMSEPVKSANARDFKLDGKNLNGKAEVIGNEIFVRTYRDMEAGEHTVTVGQLVDYNNFKSVSADFDFTVVEDKEAPKVVEAVAKTRVVVITFDEAVDKDTVNARSAYWKSGSNKKYASEYKMLSGNRVEFRFNSANELPVNETDLYLDGIKDYSGNTMKEVKVVIKPEIDTVRPEVKSVEVTEKSNNQKLNVTFTKPVKDNSSTTSNSATNPENYYVKDSKDNKIAAHKVTKGSKDNQYVVEFRKPLEEDKTYTLFISGIADTNTYANIMLSYEEELLVKDTTKPKYEGVVTKKAASNTDREYVVYFSKEMDAATLSNDDNYMIQYGNTTRVLSEVANTIELGKDNKTVTIILDKDEVKSSLDKVGVLGVKDLKDNKLSNYGEMLTVDANTNLADAIKIAKVEDVKENEKVVIEFTKPVDKVYENNVKIAGGNITRSEISGKKVTFTVEGLKANKEGANINNAVVTLAEGAVIAADGSKNAADNSHKLVDMVAPKLNDVELVQNAEGEYELKMIFSRKVDAKKAAIVISESADKYEVTPLAADQSSVSEIVLPVKLYGENANNITIKAQVINVKDVYATGLTNNTLDTKVLELDSNQVRVEKAVDEAIKLVKSEYTAADDAALVAAVEESIASADANLLSAYDLVVKATKADGKVVIELVKTGETTVLSSATKTVTVK